MGAAALAVAGAVAVGLLAKSSGDRIDASLARGKAAPAPGFALHTLVAGSSPAPGFRLRPLRAGTLPPVLRDRLRGALADGELALAELRGTPIVLNFWASWCGPCRKEAPILERGWRRAGPRGVLYLGLNMQDSVDDALSFVREFGLTYPMIRDPGDSVARAYGAVGIPETYFIDRRGRVVGHVIGTVSPSVLASGERATRQGRVIGTAAGGAQRPVRSPTSRQ